MFDLIILFDGKSYYNRNELTDLLGLSHHLDSSGEEIYSKGEKDNALIINFTDDLSDYSEDEISKIPYKVSGLCYVTFYPFEAIYDILFNVIRFNDELFADDDHGNIINICEYKDLVKKKKVYPFNYYSKDFFRNN